VPLERLWAGWRGEYVGGTHIDADGCVLCRVLESDDKEAYVLWRGRLAAVVLNAFPYTSGHLMVIPTRHVAEIEGLATEESAELWQALSRSVRALKAAYKPHGLNVGANVGKEGGAGVPGHLHLHVVPRWAGDTNFMTTVAEARVLPESLGRVWEKLTEAWPE
jgi:ATP adenylyltransferase